MPSRRPGLTDADVGLGTSPIRSYEELLGKRPVQKADLMKIILFDVTADETPRFMRGKEREISSFHGRLRNELPRPIGDVVLKASVYKSDGELIEVKQLQLYTERFEPHEPASFLGMSDIRHLPNSYTYKLEAVQASYP